MNEPPGLTQVIVSSLNLHRKFQPRQKQAADSNISVWIILDSKFRMLQIHNGRPCTQEKEGN
jgi:hypothetical protein